MSNPLVSIIMAAYNCEKTIEKAITSILSDKLIDWELIIVDDCSTDKTVTIIEKFAEVDSRIKLLKLNKNSGAATARNRAISISKGKYIAILDSDDYSINNRLLVESDFLEKNNEYAFVASNVIYFNENEKWFKSGVEKKITAKEMIKSNQVSHSTLMIKSAVIKKVGGYPNYRRCQDYAMLLNVCANGDIGYLLENRLVEYNCDFSNFLRRTKKARLTEFNIRIRAYKKMKVKSSEYIYALKPLILGCVPRGIYIKYQMKDNIYL